MNICNNNRKDLKTEGTESWTLRRQLQNEKGANEIKKKYSEKEERLGYNCVTGGGRKKFQEGRSGQ